MENPLGKNHKEQQIVPEKKEPVLKLFDLDANQKLGLEKRVQEHNGLIRVFIHPIPSLKDGTVLENQARASAVAIKTIFSEKAPPIIIFENATVMNRWERSLMKFNKAKAPKKIYMVPTVQDSPEPEDGIEKFVTLLNDIKVTRILVAGTSLEVLYDHLNRCVGNFIHLMKQHSNIELKLSLGTAPANKTEIKESHPYLVLKIYKKN